MATQEEEYTDEAADSSVIQVTDNQEETINSELRQRRQDKATPFGKTKIIEVPGYDGKLAVQYRYIDAEITEVIGKKIAKELRNVKGKRGMTLLASLDTLTAACDRVMVRNTPDEKWRPMKPEPVVIEVKQFTEGTPIAQVLGYDARDGRSALLGLYGEEHGIISAYMLLSRWLTDTSREEDEDFLEA